MSKAVECTFGILKGRWRILKTGIRLHGVEVVDDIWRTCCALHNWLLDIDGLDVEWSGELGLHDEEDANFALQRLQSTTYDPRHYDTSGIGPGEDVVGYDTLAPAHTIDVPGPTEGETVCHVKHLQMNYFRKKLVEHFHILWMQRKLVWPSRN